MNAPNAPVIQNRASGNVDAPDILQVLRRYLWLLILGTMLGVGIAVALYMYNRKYAARYKAFVQFQVLAPPPPLGGDSSPVVNMTVDDTSQFIHRQMLYIKQDRILRLILISKEFHTDYRTPDDQTRESQWLSENRNDQIRQLKRSLAVTPMIDSGAFEISMTTRDPYEAYSLVKAAQAVYMENLQSDNRKLSSDRLTTLNRATRDQETTVANLTSGLNQFRATLNVPALTSRHALELEALQQITAETIRTKSLYSAAVNGLDTITKQVKDNVFQKSADMDQFIKADREMGMLLSTRLQLQQERAAQEEQYKKTGVTNMLAPIDARMAKVDEQMDKIRVILEKEACEKMIDDATSRRDSLKAQADYLEGVRTAKEDDVRLLDSNLIQYQQKVDELRAQTEVLERLRRQNTLMNLSSNTDDVRIQPIVQASAPEPDDFVFPSLSLFLPLGIAGGLGVSFIAAYLLVLTDKRIRTPRDITKTLQLPLLGFIPDETDDRDLTGDVATALVSAPNSMIAESFRQIRSQISAQSENSPINTLLVASISPGGGSTTVASNLASGMALNGRRVLLIDANFYRPSLGIVYKNVPVEGLTDVLNDPSILASAIVPCAHLPMLHLMSAGNQLATASSEILEGKAFRELLELLRAKYDLIIFDGAPLNLVADSLTLASRVDGVISVIRAGEVSRGTVSRIREQLRQVHANLLGFVLNAAQANATGYFKENYRSFYRYAGGARRSASITR